MRYLPRGSMGRQRRQRRLGRLEGSVATLAIVALIGFGLIASAPAELYRPAVATHHPTPEGGSARIQHVQMPPCGPGKDCTEVEHDVAIVMLPRTGPQLAPLPPPQERTPANTVPEPGTLALIGAGLAGMIWRARL